MKRVKFINQILTRKIPFIQDCIVLLKRVEKSRVQVWIIPSKNHNLTFSIFIVKLRYAKFESRPLVWYQPGKRVLRQFGSWRPIKQNKTQFGDPCSTTKCVTDLD